MTKGEITRVKIPDTANLLKLRRLAFILKQNIGKLCIMENNNSVHFCSRTHKGKVRRINQDCLEIDQSRAAATIADGIGGKDFGEVASHLAVESCMSYLKTVDLDTLDKKGSRELANAIKVANETIITIQRNDPKYKDMGSTLSCFWLNQNKLHFSWVGDSRIYLLRPSDKTISMLTEDHTLDKSKIDPALAPGLYKRASSILTQMVGSILLLKPDTGSAELIEGDIILACTDGLSDRVPDELMLEYLLKLNNNKQESLEAYADKLLDRALDCGGQDNISFILAQVAAT